jgi:hypothetical protein
MIFRSTGNVEFSDRGETDRRCAYGQSRDRCYVPRSCASSVQTSPARAGTGHQALPACRPGPAAGRLTSAAMRVESSSSGKPILQFARAVYLRKPQSAGGNWSSINHGFAPRARVVGRGNHRGGCSMDKLPESRALGASRLDSLHSSIRRLRCRGKRIVLCAVWIPTCPETSGESTGHRFGFRLREHVGRVYGVDPSIQRDPFPINDGHHQQCHRSAGRRMVGGQCPPQ